MDLRLRYPLRKRCRGTEDTPRRPRRIAARRGSPEAPETLRQEYGRRARVGAAAPAGAAAGGAAAAPPASSPEPDWAKPAPAPSNEPAWARTPAPAPAPSLNERVGAAVVGAAIGAATPPMDMSFLNLPKPILAMRFMNVLSAFMLSFCAITKLMTTDRLAPGIVAVYIFIFAVAIFLFELHIPQLGRGLAENLGFLYSAMGRFWFLILVAILAASGHGLWGIFTVILVVCTAVVNAVIWWKYPDYEKGCRIVDLGQA